MCHPIIDAPRLQDVIDANRYSFLVSDTNGITCDIASQDPTGKFNESCTKVPLEVTSIETGIGEVRILDSEKL